jgi:hypothetical protein
MISFGAPPVTRPDLSRYILGNSPCSNNRGIVLSVVNEHDLVSRVDGAYARSLIDLYRSIYGLPPTQDEEVMQGESVPAPHLPKLSFDASVTELESNFQQLPVWRLPKPEYWNIGKIVIFKVMMAESDLPGFKEDELLLRAMTVSPTEFKRLLFCDVSSHRRKSYKERTDLLLRGRCNGRQEW